MQQFRQLLLLMLTLLLSWQHCMSTGSITVPPLKAIQPLYVCKMQVSDLPSFSGSPSPEMLAANIGLSEALAGMLEYWNINDAASGAAAHQEEFNTSPPAQESPVQMLAAPSPSPALLTNAGISAPGSSSSAVGVGSLATASAAEAAIAMRHLMGAAAARSPGNTEAEVMGAASAATEVALPAIPAMPCLNDCFGEKLNALTDAAVTQNDHWNTDATPAAASVSVAEESGMTPDDSQQHQVQEQQQKQAQQQFPSTLAAAAATATDHQPMQQQQQQQQQSVQQFTSSRQRSLLLSAADPATDACTNGSHEDSSTATGTSPGSPRFGLGGAGFNGISMAKTQVIPPDVAMAVGPDTAVHIVNSLLAVYRVNSGTGNPQQGVSTTPVKQVAVPDFFTLVASTCSGGYFSPAAVYDKLVGRFIITTVCGGDAYQVLVAVSRTSSALESWVLYSFAGEVTQGTPMVCGGYPTSLHTQVAYNKDGVYVTFVQNCPNNQEQATGAVLYALPKWAVYKGATYFWVPVFTAWEVQRAAGLQGSENYPPSAFLQMQPVQPQRPEDVQAEIAYFVNDNFIYNEFGVLQRTTFTLSALINTGSLWLYEGPGTASPTPLLVARVIPRGMDCMAVSSTRLTQPDGCGQLNAGGVRPPGFWDGGAVLFSNKIYLADRGPDVLDQASTYQPTVYWAMLQPSFCMHGPCAQWFGLDWGWSSGWDWTTGSWAAQSDRGRNPYADPGYYYQQFVYPFQSSKRRLQETSSSSSSTVGSNMDNYTTQNTNSYTEGPTFVERNALGVAKAASTSPATVSMAAAASSAATAKKFGPVASKEQLRAAVAAQQALMEALQADQNASDQTLGKVKAAGLTLETADLADLRSQYKKAAKYAGSETAGARIMFRPARDTSIISSSSVGGVSASTAGNRTVEASGLLLLGAASFVWNGFMGWGLGFNGYYYDYYQYYLQYYLARTYRLSQAIPPRINPCKYYKSWPSDTSVTFGAIMQNSGVLEYATGVPQEQAVGLAFPQVAVRGGQMLVVYSFAGPNTTPDGSRNKAYPGVAFSTIPITKATSSYSNYNRATITNSTFNMVKQGAGCISQYGSAYWGAYSGLDTHYPSYRVWSAVEYAATAPSDNVLSNAAIWIATL